MPLTFYPRAGVVLMCDFEGYVAPEMVKKRPVIVVSPRHLERSGLHTVVPMSTTPPNEARPYHLRLTKNPMPNSLGDVWVKCDMVATVRTERLDRIKVSRGNYVTTAVTPEELSAIRQCLKYVLGIT